MSISQIETGVITFTNSESETVSFSQSYNDPPFVTLTPIGEDVEAHIVSITSSLMVVQLSQKMNVTVDYQIFETS
tara:strand:+ start:451 stop:675 length:225 start_codon:yes stop_codon:yes gene_type:complete